MQLQQLPLINGGFTNTFDVHGKSTELSYQIKEGSISGGKCILMGFDKFAKRYMGTANIDADGNLSNIQFIKD